MKNDLEYPVREYVIEKAMTSQMANFIGECFAKGHNVTFAGIAGMGKTRMLKRFGQIYLPTETRKLSLNSEYKPMSFNTLVIDADDEMQRDKLISLALSEETEGKFDTVLFHESFDMRILKLDCQKVIEMHAKDAVSAALSLTNKALKKPESNALTKKELKQLVAENISLCVMLSQIFDFEEKKMKRKVTGIYDVTYNEETDSFEDSALVSYCHESRSWIEYTENKEKYLERTKR